MSCARVPIVAPSTRTRTSGLTLVELLVGLAIGSVLIGLGAPAWQDQLERRRLEGGLQHLRSELQLLRLDAVARQQTLRLGFGEGPGLGSCFVSHTGPGGACTCNPADGSLHCSPGAQALRSQHWPAASKVALSSNVASLAVSPLLGTLSPSATLKLVDSRGRELRAVLSVMGRVRSCQAGGRALPGHPAC